MLQHTGVPFSWKSFFEALETIYKHTHPPDGKKEGVPKSRKES